MECDVLPMDGRKLREIGSPHQQERTFPSACAFARGCILGCRHAIYFPIKRTTNLSDIPFENLLFNIVEYFFSPHNCFHKQKYSTFHRDAEYFEN